MTTILTLDHLQNLSDDALWALWDENNDLASALPIGSWERGIALANQRVLMVEIDRRRLQATATPLR